MAIPYWQPALSPPFADVFQIDLPLRTLFEAPTIRRLAIQIERAQLEKRELDAPPLIAVERPENLPLSFAQQRLWLLDKIEPGNPFYNVPIAMRLQGNLDLAALEASLKALQARHETLRTVFVETPAGPCQQITSATEIAMTHVDLRDEPEATREKTLAEQVLVEGRTPFSLAEGPLWRVRLFVLGDQDHLLMIHLHHIITDGWSLSILVREFSQAYAAHCHHQQPPWQALPLQYADYALWQRRWLVDDALEKRIDYWRQTLHSPLPQLNLPLTSPGRQGNPTGAIPTTHTYPASLLRV